MTYEARKQQLISTIRASQGTIGLQKETSNLFRERAEEKNVKLDVRNFCNVLEVNAEEGWVEAEGMTPYATLVDETLKHGCVPAVVPQLRSITIGGAISGVGIEASSFREGLVHETILEMEVLLANGTVVKATPVNEHKDLFFGLPNSYGTLGYILKVRAKIIPAKKFVHLEYKKYSHPSAYFADLERTCKETSATYVDGVVFSQKDMVLITGTFVDDAPYVSDYTWMKIFYKSIRNRSDDYLTTHDFIWRWDTDWFWCSKNLGMHYPLLRFILGRKRLNSLTYNAIMRWNNRTKFSERFIKPFQRTHSESVIQDICIPVSNAPAFLDFLDREIGIFPVWTCPSASPDTSKIFPLFPANHTELMIDFGFWDFVKTKEKHQRGFFNQKVEEKTLELGGLKSLYSEAFYNKETFWRIYNGPVYTALKNVYDPARRLKDLYEKCVLRA